MSSKRQKERDYFDRFRRVFNDLPGDAVFGDRPDVIVKGKQTIGVEITQLYLEAGRHAGSEQRQRPLRDSAVANAQAIFTKMGGPPIECTAGFQPRSLTRGIIDKLANALAKAVLCFESDVSGEVRRELYESALPEVSSLYVNRKEYAAPVWRVAQAHNVGLMLPAAVQAAIDDKEAKAAGYAACDAFWLLIVVEPMDPAQEQEIRVGQVTAHSEVFERAIVYKPTFEHVVEIDLRTA